MISYLKSYPTALLIRVNKVVWLLKHKLRPENARAPDIEPDTSIEPDIEPDTSILVGSWYFPTFRDTRYSTQYGVLNI